MSESATPETAIFTTRICVHVLTKNAVLHPKEGFPAIFQTGPQNQLELGSAGLLVCGCPSHHPSPLEQTRTYVSCDQMKGKEFVISSPHIYLDCSARQLDI